MIKQFTKYPEKYVKATTEGCVYKVVVQFGDYAQTAEEYVIDAPCGLSDKDLYEYLPWDLLKSKLEVVSAENDEEDYLLSKDEIDDYDSAWGFHAGVPEDEYDEELAEEGYYDDYYDEPQYSGYMSNLQWVIKFEYKGFPEVTYIYETEDDAWKSEEYIEEGAWEYALEEFKITSVQVVG